jgi:hypothetical protein
VLADGTPVTEILMRAVRGGGAAEMMALDDAGEALPLGYAADVDEVALAEDVGPDNLADAEVFYLFGGQARYLKEGGISFEDSQRQLDIRRSRTDMLFFNIGLAIQSTG